MERLSENSNNYCKCSFLNSKKHVVAMTTCRTGTHLVDDVIIGAFMHRASSVVIHEIDNSKNTCRVVLPDELESISNLRYHLQVINVDLNDSGFLSDKILAAAYPAED